MYVIVSPFLSRHGVTGRFNTWTYSSWIFLVAHFESLYVWITVTMLTFAFWHNVCSLWSHVFTHIWVRDNLFVLTPDHLRIALSRVLSKFIVGENLGDYLYRITLGWRIDSSHLRRPSIIHPLLSFNIRHASLLVDSSQRSGCVLGMRLIKRLMFVKSGDLICKLTHKWSAFTEPSESIKECLSHWSVTWILAHQPVSMCVRSI